MQKEMIESTDTLVWDSGLKGGDQEPPRQDMSHEMKYDMTKSISKASSTGGIQGLCNGSSDSARAGVWVRVKALSALMGFNVPDQPPTFPLPLSPI